MYYDIICHKLWIMVAEYYFRTWFVDFMAKLLKRTDSVCQFSFNNKCFMIIEDIRFIFVVVYEIIQKQEC